MPVVLRELGGRPRVLAQWPRAGAGHYQLEVTGRDGDTPWIERGTWTVPSRKLPPDEVRQLVDDLERRLPASIAISLQRAGALADLKLITRSEFTLAEELDRLRRAIHGTTRRAGLTQILRQLAQRPHQVLSATERWTPREQARRIDPLRLAHAYRRAGNVDRNLTLIEVPERPVRHSVDVYENRVVNSFYAEVNARVAVIAEALMRDKQTTSADEAARLLHDLRAARREAAFLDEVSPLSQPPSHVTMVLARRSEYRAALDGLLELRRTALVRLNEPAVDAPLENLPHLFQQWAVLEAIDVILDVAVEAGFEVRREQLSYRSGGELWIRILPNGVPALILLGPGGEPEVRVIPQRTYVAGVAGLHSISFNQIPDLAIETSQGETTRIALLDPKYKLRSEDIESSHTDGRPKKVDIDAMHAYRDAIRDIRGDQVVSYAAIMYPGATKTFAPGLQALQARPSSVEPLRVQLERLARGVLSLT